MLNEGSEFAFLLKIVNGKNLKSESCIKEQLTKTLVHPLKHNPKE